METKIVPIDEFKSLTTSIQNMFAPIDGIFQCIFFSVYSVCFTGLPEKFVGHIPFKFVHDMSLERWIYNECEVGSTEKWIILRDLLWIGLNDIARPTTDDEGLLGEALLL